MSVILIISKEFLSEDDSTIFKVLKAGKNKQKIHFTDFPAMSVVKKTLAKEYFMQHIWPVDTIANLEYA